MVEQKAALKVYRLVGMTVETKVALTADMTVQILVAKLVDLLAIT